MEVWLGYLWFVVVTLSVGAFLLLLEQTKQVRSRLPPSCKKCGYVLTGLALPTTCPECGQEDAALHAYDHYGWHWSLGIIAGGFILSVIGLMMAEPMLTVFGCGANVWPYAGLACLLFVCKKKLDACSVVGVALAGTGTAAAFFLSIYFFDHEGLSDPLAAIGMFFVSLESLGAMAFGVLVASSILYFVVGRRAKRPGLDVAEAENEDQSPDEAARS